MKIIKVHEDCKLVLGVSRCLIVDFSRNKYLFIPLSLSNILQQYEGKSLSLILTDFEEDKEIIGEYLNFLEKEEIIFYCESVEEYSSFTQLPLDWDFPSIISNAVWDIKEDVYDYIAVLRQLEQIGCQHITFRFFDNAKINKIWEIMDYLNYSTVCSIELVANDNAFNNEKLEKMIMDYPRLIRIILYACNKESIKEQVQQIYACSILRTTDAIDSSLQCGVVNYAHFAINIPHFTESVHHNTCLNRKISIDAEGNIKNCPSMAKNYGNIKDTKLIDVVNNPDFKKVWHIKKDEITKCKDCEFRHICTDCRAYIENPEDQYSAPLKCGYNPYTCEWEEWSSNPLKQQAIAYYGMKSPLR